MIRACFLGAMILLLAACSPLGGMNAFYHRVPLEEELRQNVLNFRATRILKQDAVLASCCRVYAISRDSKMLLLGQVQRPEHRRRALALITDLPSVSKVLDRTTVQAPLSWGEQAQDGWITLKMKSMMLFNWDIDPSKFKVTTENKIVYCLGLPKAIEKQEILAIAQDIPGIKTVVFL